MSFTTATLLHRESVTLAALLAELGDWNAVREKVIADNLLQMRTLNTSKRIFREISSRLKQLTPAELALLRDGTRQEQGYLLWLAVCKRYRFLYEFARDVLHEKLHTHDLTLAPEEYDRFFNAKAEWRPEVEGVSPVTRRKQRQFLFKMLREAGLLTADMQIVPALLTPRLVEAIRQDDPAHFAVFPVSLANLRNWSR